MEISDAFAKASEGGFSVETEPASRPTRTAPPKPKPQEKPNPRKESGTRPQKMEISDAFAKASEGGFSEDSETPAPRTRTAPRPKLPVKKSQPREEPVEDTEEEPDLKSEVSVSNPTQLKLGEICIA